MRVTMTPSEPLAVILKDFPSLYSSSGSSQHIPSRFWRSVASDIFGRPSSFFFSDVKCGARTMQPVWPVHESRYSAASFF